MFYIIIYFSFLLSDELKSLEEEGFGKYCSSSEQRLYGSGTELGYNLQNVFFKPAPFHLDRKFIQRLRLSEITEEYYISQFRKEIDPALVNCVKKFHPHVKDIEISQSSGAVSGNLIIL